MQNMQPETPASSGRRIPYVLLTNGGGVSEYDRCRKLTQQLGVPIDPSQYIQAHTILKTLSHKYSDKAVLVLGGKFDTVRKVARSYGYKKAYTTLDVLAWNRSVWPFHDMSQAELETAEAVTGAPYPYVQYGKPTVATYNFAAAALADRLKEASGTSATLPEVYMVGDNPESDIAGANAAGWSSVLVQTGVFDPQNGPPSHTPSHIAKDVEAAVKWAIDRELARGV
ncbi:hypothetical protein H0H92_002309 [Tricholoma furcatifolium]|nr:hypothetical protein H0H92_002309 [Tricholoma furcatifolium]